MHHKHQINSLRTSPHIHKLFYITLTFLLLNAAAYAQDQQKIIRRIDSLAGLGLPKSALAETDKLAQLARKQKDAALQIRAEIYRLQFISETEEKALPAIVSHLQKQIPQTVYPVRSVLHAMLGNVYLRYYQQQRGNLYNKPYLPDAGSDIDKWSAQNFVNEMRKEFDLSLQDSLKAQQTPVGLLDGLLAGDSTNRYLRPKLYDLLLARALDFYLMDEISLMQPKSLFELNDEHLFDDGQSFAKLRIPAADTLSNAYIALKLIRQATAFHLKNNDAEAVADLDLRRFSFLYRQSGISKKDELYLAALNRLANRLSLRSSADALVMIGTYYRNQQELVKAMDYFQQAIDRDPKGLAAKNAAGFMDIIKRPGLELETESPFSPDRPLLASVGYANIDTLKLSYYKLSKTELDHFESLTEDQQWFNAKKKYLRQAYIRTLKSTHEQLIPLPDLKDYKQHHTEIKIDPLDKGTYVMAATYTNAPDTIQPMLLALKITDINYAVRETPDGKIGIVVANRFTGKPMPGIKVIANKNKTYTTGTDGQATMDIDRANYALVIHSTDDSLVAPRRSTYGNRLPTSGKPDISTAIFTDREIYRPGQTMYYSGLHIQTLGGKSTVLPNTKLKVSIRFNYSTLLDSVLVTTNEFGTFKGSYIIPETVRGNLALSTDLNRNKNVRVEEYKRPTFELTFNKVDKTYYPNDSVTVKGKVTAYSGYGISNARVALKIDRQFNYSVLTNFSTASRSGSLTLIDTVLTDARGNFSYKFKAEPGEGYKPNELTFDFNINATVTDGNNETRQAQTAITVAANNLRIINRSDKDQFFAQTDSLKYQVALTDLGGRPVKGKVTAMVYSLKKPAAYIKNKIWFVQPDTFVMDSTTYRQTFPNYIYKGANWNRALPLDKLIGQSTAQADSLHPVWADISLLKGQPSGPYRIIFKGLTAKGDTAVFSANVNWFDKPVEPLGLPWVSYIPSKDSSAAAKTFYLGNGAKANVLVEAYDGAVLRSAKWYSLPAGKQQVLNLPAHYQGKELSYQFLMMWDSQIEHRYYPASQVPAEKLDIKLITFRNKLQPGQAEQWTLQVRKKGDPAASAEMVASLYDASLDDLTRYGYAPRWPVNFGGQQIPREYFSWDYRSDYDRRTSGYLNINTYFYGIPRNYERLLMFGYDYQNNKPISFALASVRLNGKAYAVGDKNLPADILAKIPGMAVDDYGDQASSGGALMFDEPVGNSDVKAVLNEVSIQPGQKFSSDTVQYMANSRAALPYVTPRTNFNETAFFYPQLRTDEQGRIVLAFTMPQSLTKWRFQAFAHTKDMVTGYITQDVLTQKQLSVDAGMPRFFRSGDTITVAARVSNLTANKLKGRVQLQFFNGINMQPVSLLADTATSTQTFELDGLSNRSINFKLIVPDGLEALTYRIAAASDGFTDAEENTLPVLSKQVLVTATMPMMVRPGEQKTFNFADLAANHSPTLKSKTLTLTYTQNPAWYAIQALPSLTGTDDDCAEQLFNRYFANSLAKDLVNKQPALKRVFDRWKAGNSTELTSNLDKNKELKTALLNESPWLREAQSETEQNKRLALLFDVNQMGYELQTVLANLQTKQLQDGGFAWYGGDRPDSYITRYILAGIGQLCRAGLADKKETSLHGVVNRAMNYSDTLLKRESKVSRSDKDQLSADDIYAWYARSYFTDVPMTSELKALLDAHLKLATQQWLNKSKYEQGLIALTLLRYGKPAEAQKIIRSLKETAQHHADLGMYWAQNQNGYHWYQAPIETQSLLIQLFTEAGGNQKEVDEMKIWLLQNKQTNSWQTGKATSAACFALLMNGSSFANDELNSKISIGGTDLGTLKPDAKAEAGTGYLKTTWTNEQIIPDMAKVAIANNGKTINWAALYWQYLEDADKVKASQSGMQLERKYFIVTNNNPVPVDAKHQPKPGDLLKVVMYVKADRDMEYIHLKDNRPAGTEPVDVLSTYKYQSGLYYYMVTRDLSTNFYIDRLGKGSYVFEYSLRVAQPGSYSAGLSTIQSMYAPEFNATATSQRINVMAK